MSQNQRKDYFWNTMGVLAQNAISPLLLIAVTRINGVYDSGIFSYALAIALIFWAFGIWGGRTYQVSDLQREFTNHSYVVVRILLGGAILLASILFCVANGYDIVKTSIIVAFVIFKIFESIADAIYGILQTKGKLFITGKSLFIKAILGSLMFIVVDIIFKDLLWSVFALIFVNIAVFIFYDLYYARQLNYYLAGIVGGLSRYTQEAGVIIRRCAPIAAVIFLSMFSLNIPRYFLDKFHSGEIGYFGILVMPITVLALVITFLLQPKIIYLSELFAERKYENLNRTIRDIVIIVVGVGLIGLALAYLIGIPVLNSVFNLDFNLYFTALIVVVIGAIANAIVSVYMNIFTIIRHFKVLFYTLATTNIGLLFLSAVFVDRYSLLGAVVLFAGINFLQAIILVLTYQMLIKKYINDNVASQKSQ